MTISTQKFFNYDVITVTCILANIITPLKFRAANPNDRIKSECDIFSTSSCLHRLVLNFSEKYVILVGKEIFWELNKVKKNGYYYFIPISNGPHGQILATHTSTYAL